MFEFITAFWAPSEVLISRKLNVIEGYCNNTIPSYCRLFVQTEGDLIKSVGIDSVRIIENIVVEVAAAIIQEGRPKITDSSCERVRSRQIEALRVGFARLEILQPNLSTPIEKDERENARRKAQRDAIRKDDAIFAKLLAWQHQMEHVKVRSNILVHNILDPNATPVPIDVEEGDLDLLECGDVRRYLRVTDKATHPELWVRYTEQKIPTPSGSLWRWLPTDGSVLVEHLGFVELHARRRYTLVLGYEKERKKESWKVLDIPCCCPRDLKCDLGRHLSALWPNHRIILAKNIRKDIDEQTKVFDDELIDPFTNNLLVTLEPASPLAEVLHDMAISPL